MCCFFSSKSDFLSDLTEKQFTAVNYHITGLVCFLIWHPGSMKRHVLSLQSDDVSSHTRALLPAIHNIQPPLPPVQPFQTAASCSSPCAACKSSPGCSDILAPSYLVNVKHLDRLPCDYLCLQEPTVFQRQHVLHSRGVGVGKASAVRGQEAGRQLCESQLWLHEFILVAGEAVC